MIKSRPDGIDLEDLHETITSIATCRRSSLPTRHDHEARIDDVGIQAILKDPAVHQAHSRRCALSGMILPFVEKLQPWTSGGRRSLSISGHKMIGSPIPCGVTLARKGMSMHCPPRRICWHARHHHRGSRNGSRRCFVVRVRTVGIEGFQMVRDCQRGLRAGPSAGSGEKPAARKFGDRRF